METLDNKDYINELNVYEIYSNFNKVYYLDKEFKSAREKLNALKKVYDEFSKYRQSQKEQGFINNYNASQDICNKLYRKINIVQKEINDTEVYDTEVYNYYN